MILVEGLFERAAFVSELGLRLVDAGPGRCKSELEVRAGRL
jgi:acyl-coenzyme A thioesterase PaaI-like protein